MSDMTQLKLAFHKHWPIIIGGGLLVAIYLYIRKRDAATAAATALPAATQYVPVASGPSDGGNDSDVLAQQSEVLQAGLLQQQLQNQATAQTQANQIAYMNTVGQTAANVGQAVAGMYTAESELPAAALADATAANQTALSSSAAVAAAGVQALPGYLQGAADLTEAAYQPITAYANGLGKMVSGTESSASSIANSLVSSANGASSAAAQAAGSTAMAGAEGSAATGRNMIQGAGTGAMAGSVFGPWGTMIGAGVGGLAGAME